jgi:hypothetical protein
MICPLNPQKSVFAAHLPPNNPQEFFTIFDALQSFCESHVLQEKREKREKSEPLARIIHEGS